MLRTSSRSYWIIMPKRLKTGSAKCEPPNGSDLEITRFICIELRDFELPYRRATLARGHVNSERILGEYWRSWRSSISNFPSFDGVLTVGNCRTRTVSTLNFHNFALLNLKIAKFRSFRQKFTVCCFQPRSLQKLSNTTTRDFPASEI